MSTPKILLIILELTWELHRGQKLRKFQVDSVSSSYNYSPLFSQTPGIVLVISEIWSQVLKKKGGTRINQHHLISAWTFLASTCVLWLNKNFNQMMKTNSGLHGFPPSSFKSCPVYSSKLDDVQSACAKNITGSCEWFQRAYQTELETALLPPCHYHFLILRSALISPDAE